jgi:hypothetical protein
MGETRVPLASVYESAWLKELGALGAKKVANTPQLVPGKC